MSLPVEVKFVSDDFLDSDRSAFHLEVIKAMIASGCFYRSKSGVLQFAPDPQRPRDLIGVARPSEVASILSAGVAVKLTGEALTLDGMKALCAAVLDHRWRIPSVATAPYFAPIPGNRS
jgi:hypothetical protein